MPIANAINQASTSVAQLKTWPHPYIGAPNFTSYCEKLTSQIEAFSQPIDWNGDGPIGPTVDSNDVLLIGQMTYDVGFHDRPHPSLPKD
jgi:hypothetical protein